MFGKKEKEVIPQPVAPVSYTNWSEDFGFLFLILERKKRLVKAYIIEPFGDQLEKGDFVNDKDIKPRIEDIVAETIEALSPKYTEFLCTKYFADRDQLIKFITQDVYDDLVSSTISKNNTIIGQRLVQQNLNNLKIQSSKGAK